MLHLLKAEMISGGLFLTRRRNVHLDGFAADTNEPNSRTAPLAASYRSVNRLTEVNASLFASIERGPPRQIIDIVENFHATLAYLNEDAAQNNDLATTFYSNALNGYNEELNATRRSRRDEIDRSVNEGNGSDNEAEAQDELDA